MALQALMAPSAATPTRSIAAALPHFRRRLLRRQRSGVGGCAIAALGVMLLTLAVGKAGSSLTGFVAPPCRRSGGVPPRLAPTPPPAATEPPSWGLREALAALAASAVAVASVVVPPVAQARDGTIAPPTCVSIIDSAQNCPARPSKGGTLITEGQLREAQARLDEAEKKAGKKLGLEESQLGELEMVNFWQAELKRLTFNKEVLGNLRSEILSGSASPLRFPSRLTIWADDVAKEVEFWCEAIGMQRYESLAGGGAVVAFGPPGLMPGEEGAFFGLEIQPSSGRPAQGGAPSRARLSYVSVATPALIRISRVIASGGVLIDGYGYYDIRSPGGIEVRAYIDDRRDPVEFVALAVNEGEDMAAVGKELEAFGLKPSGPYQMVSPVTQSYMPKLPDGNVLYGGGDPKLQAQVLVVPIAKPKQKSFFELLPRGASIVMDDQGRPTVDILEQEDEVTTPISLVQGPPRLTVLFPKGAPAPSALAADASGAEAATLELSK
eukprot:CAMPEP_0177437466 /NCGR_PEP_ID=MMETSP0369-20130122/2216_1 /TAXON_ID=447022 ORGANISM="Scrippsiella hangoei-like, Strain SHHI-4" /NCGR_SAMPLE_ID=MMETSP0369 /ASSEMBLY_ACC=CAM_ASM_000364 /LENGTH=495 /DNA_ID=CAMNT_0018908927 /DNA_START=51 /DNA_END=1538 /DNA_ORIENTATION=+